MVAALLEEELWPGTDGWMDGWLSIHSRPCGRRCSERSGRGLSASSGCTASPGCQLGCACQADTQANSRNTACGKKKTEK